MWLLGESVADTSTSSPDLISPASPKMSECVPSPDSTPGPGVGAVAGRHLLPERPPSAEPPRQDVPGPFDGGGGVGGGGDNNPHGVIRVTPRSHSPPLKSASEPMPDLSIPPRPHSSPVRHIESSPPHPSPHIHPPSPQHTQIPARNTPGVITSQPSTAAAFWVQNARINGVKPELIGGNFAPATLLTTHTTSTDMKPPMLSPGQHRGSLSTTTPIRQTPTVIMGEAGGVSNSPNFTDAPYT